MPLLHDYYFIILEMSYPLNKHKRRKASLGIPTDMIVKLSPRQFNDKQTFQNKPTRQWYRIYKKGTNLLIRVHKQIFYIDQTRLSKPHLL